MSQLPTINKTTQTSEPVVTKTPRKPEPEQPKCVLVAIELPMLESVFEGYFSNRADVQNLTTNQRSSLRAILFGLQSKFAKLESGKLVSNASDAIKWIIENATKQP